MIVRDWTHYMRLRLAEAIALEVPPGVGGWPAAWEIVEEPSQRFLTSLHWLERGIGDPKEAVRMGQEVLEAWRKATRMWRAAQEVFRP
jgi:hypothetical protein